MVAGDIITAVLVPQNCTLWIIDTMKRILSRGWILFLICLTVGCQNAPLTLNPLETIKTPKFRRFEQALQLKAKEFSSSTEIQVLAAGDSPALSPNGQYIAFAGPGTDSENYIWLMDSEGNNLKQLTHFGRESVPQWSPDGQKIIFGSYGPKDLIDNRKSAIWTVDIDGKNLRQLIPSHAKGDRNPSWSPDGQYILWTRNNRFDNLWIADSQGQNARPLTAKPNEVYAKSKWSTDSQTLYTLSADTSTLVTTSEEPPPLPFPCTTQTWTAIDIRDRNNRRTVKQPFTPILQEQNSPFYYCVDQDKLFKIDRHSNTLQVFDFPGLTGTEYAIIAPDQKTLIFGLVRKGGGDSILALKLKGEPSTSGL